MTLLARITLATSLSLSTCEEQKQDQAKLESLTQRIAAINEEKQQLGKTLQQALRDRPPGSNPGNLLPAAYAQSLEASLRNLQAQVKAAQGRLQALEAAQSEANRRLARAKAQASTPVTPLPTAP